MSPERGGSGLCFPGPLGVHALVRNKNCLVISALRTYRLTTFAPYTPAGLAGIGDLLKISQCC
jgi:hypothetical protein